MQVPKIYEYQVNIGNSSFSEVRISRKIPNKQVMNVNYPQFDENPPHKTRNKMSQNNNKIKRKTWNDKL